jgi:LysM repeat protein
MALTKIKIMLVHTQEVLDIHAYFNPTEYTINKDNNFAVQTIPGLPGPLIQFVNGNLRTLEMELLFDTWSEYGSTGAHLPKRDVRDETKKVTDLLEIDSNLHAPPQLVVSWSSLQFRCVLARASQKFILFADDGTPVRARLTVTFNEVIEPVLEVLKINPQTADFSKVHVVTQGETISGIAAKFYENPQLWRPIAIANDIADPRAIFTGQTLRIPSLPFVDPESLEVTV